MKKKLKLGFAMGGGVSLGAFSGGALSEVIKQAILHGSYKVSDNKWEQYEQVEVDVFSGASAGSMSLAIMLRGMAYQTPKERELAEGSLGGILAGMSQKKKAQLIAAQVVQDLQKKAWVKEIKIEKLLPDDKDLTNEGGLFYRGALESIAKDIFQFNSTDALDFSNKQILSDRVLFASTLSNLTGLNLDSRIEDNNAPKSANYKPLKDAYTSQSHKELRVFDLNFVKLGEADILKVPGDPDQGPKPDFPSFWVRYHTGEKLKDVIFSLNSKKSWAQIVATSIACGAFPFAFTPVTLKRYDFEFNSGLWPKDLKEYLFSLEKEEKNKNLSYPFSYIDGGAFNNEPVREAFRLASHLDAKEDPETFDRAIVFVDPNVSDHPVIFNVPVFKEFSSYNGNWFKRAVGYDSVFRLSSMERFIPHVVNLMSIMRQQASVDENDKIFKTLQLFDNRKQYYELFDSLVDSINPNQLGSMYTDLKKLLTQLIENQAQNQMLPQGATTLQGEFKRILYSNRKKYAGISDKDLDLFDQKDDAIKKTILKACFAVFIDQMINLTGKSPDAKIIGVAPARWTDENGNRLAEPQIMILPGSELSAFGGFFSERTREFVFRAGINCAVEFMKYMNLLDNKFTPEFFDWKEKESVEKLLHRELKEKIPVMTKRIDNLIQKSSFLRIFPGLDFILLKSFSFLINQKLKEIEFMAQPFVNHILKIKVKSMKFEIDGKLSGSDIKPIEENGKYFLVLELKYFTETNLWDTSNNYIQNNKIFINAPGFLSLSDKRYRMLSLPESKLVANARLVPNPVFEIDISDEITNSEWSLGFGVELLEEKLLLKS